MFAFSPKFFSNALRLKPFSPEAQQFALYRGTLRCVALLGVLSRRTCSSLKGHSLIERVWQSKTNDAKRRLFVGINNPRQPKEAKDAWRKS